MLLMDFEKDMDLTEVVKTSLRDTCVQLFKKAKKLSNLAYDFISHPLATSLALYVSRREHIQDTNLARVCDPWEYIDIQHRNEDWDYGLL